jgi:hypothetical protein
LSQKFQKSYLLTGRKVCSICIVEKESSEFYFIDKTKTKLRNACKECMYLEKTRGKDFNKEERDAYKKRKSEAAKEYRRRANYYSYEKSRDTMLKTKYGITLEDFNKMSNDQGGKCYTCGETPDLLCVDHCHTTGKVRKLLCDNCNKTLGLIKENIETFKKLADYVVEHSSKNKTCGACTKSCGNDWCCMKDE